MIVEFEWDDLMSLLKGQLPKEAIINAIDMIGTPVEDFTDDVIRIEIYPNRPDLLSAGGMARALNGFLGFEVGYPMWRMAPTEVKCKLPENRASLLRPFLSFAVTKGVKLNDAAIKDIMQLQEKLHVSLGRNRAKYSIGVYDTTNIRFPIRYEEWKLDDIAFIPLEGTVELTGRQILEETDKGKAYAHLLPEDRAPVLLDAFDKILSMPPVINAEFCKIDATSTNLLIDATGTSPGTDDMVAIVATALAERGGTLQSVTPGPTFLPKRISIDYQYIRSLLGLEITDVQIGTLLNKMRFGTVEEVMIPPYRIDISNSMDLAEDVAIAYGYDNFEYTLPKMNLFGQPLKDQLMFTELRKLMVGFGFLETKGFNLVSPLAAAMVGASHIGVSNAKSSEYSTLRPSILPSLYHLLLRNKDSEYPQKIFEIGSVFVPGQEKRIAGFIAHGAAGFSEVKGIVDALHKLMRPSEELSWKNDQHFMFMEGRTAVSEWGVYGELSPKLSQQIGMPLAGFELKLDFV
ncbi:MAG: phenylalanine--tRNA ligase subunit beta [Candidatus Altiarchaeota archaeon]|nr:phenylalanine--tRNA ligase subunit beta [Candidatus Altiarchaeota archaeon]